MKPAEKVSLILVVYITIDAARITKLTSRFNSDILEPISKKVEGNKQPLFQSTIDCQQVTTMMTPVTKGRAFADHRETLWV